MELLQYTSWNLFAEAIPAPAHPGRPSIKLRDVIITPWDGCITAQRQLTRTFAGEKPVPYTIMKTTLIASILSLSLAMAAKAGVVYRLDAS
ncbi:MAG: hypothetical protein LUC86_02970, partial [Prevotellaceae bacterium]|nr:hypothetical protein [Prevotellaceae bacterium]